MNFDGVRNPAYKRAIQEAVRSNSVVLDLGAGLGLLGFIAARAGARKVYLVEPEPVIEVARKVAEANGLGNVVCIQATAETLVLADKVDLIVSVFTGNFLLTEDLLPSLFYARDHFLAPGGQLIPDRGRMMVAPVSAPNYYQDKVGNWSFAQASTHGIESCGIDYEVARPYAANSLYYDSVDTFKAQLLADPACLTDMDFMTATRAECDSAVELSVKESGECHGWLGWFDTRLGQEWLSTGPNADSTHWRQVFMPIEKPIAVKAGQILRFGLKRPEFGEWTWTTSFDGQQQRQSTFLSEPLTPEILQKKTEGFQPKLNERGHAAQYALSRFDGSESTGALADVLLTHFGSSFSSREDAVRFVKALANKYT
jgi:SAM-dependent methyltransferase